MVASGVAALACAGCAPSPVSAVAVVPTDGTTHVVFDAHLPGGFGVTNVRAELDGEVVMVMASPATRATLFHASLPDGDHTLSLTVDVRVPCGLTSAPYEKLTARISRSFAVDQAGGLVYVDAFAESPWQNPVERVHLLVSLRGGVRDGRWIYGRSREADQACGRLDPIQRSRCVVQRLVERSRAQKDVAGLLCQKDKLEAMDELLSELDRSTGSMEPSPVGESAARSPVTIEAARVRVATLERQAEYCVGEDSAYGPTQQITTDRSACAAYDDPLGH